MRSTCKPLLIVAFVGTVVAIPALAQQSSSDYPTPCEASKVSKGDVERAHTVFLSGKQYLEESNYDKAISYFKDAYSIDCSIHAILPIIATACERKGDKAEAVHALEEYQKRAPTAPDHEVIDRRIHNLRDQLAREQPAPSASGVSTAGAPMASTAPAATAPLSGVPAAAPAPSASAGPESPPPGPEGGHSVAPWILVGGGGVAVVAGVILYVIGSGDISTAEGHCPDHHCPLAGTTDQ